MVEKKGTNQENHRGHISDDTASRRAPGRSFRSIPEEVIVSIEMPVDAYYRPADEEEEDGGSDDPDPG